MDDRNLNGSEHEDKEDQGEEAKHIIVSRLVCPDRFEYKEEFDEDRSKWNQAAKHDGRKSSKMIRLSRDLSGDLSRFDGKFPWTPSPANEATKDRQRQINTKPHRKQCKQRSEW